MFYDNNERDGVPRQTALTVVPVASSPVRGHLVTVLLQSPSSRVLGLAGHKGRRACVRRAGRLTSCQKKKVKCQKKITSKIDIRYVMCQPPGQRAAQSLRQAKADGSSSLAKHFVLLKDTKPYPLHNRTAR